MHQHKHFSLYIHPLRLQFCRITSHKFAAGTEIRLFLLCAFLTHLASDLLCAYHVRRFSDRPNGGFTLTVFIFATHEWPIKGELHSWRLNCYSRPSNYDILLTHSFHPPLNTPGNMELLCQCWDHIIYLGSCWVLGYKYGPNPGTVKGNHCCL